MVRTAAARPPRTRPQPTLPAPPNRTLYRTIAALIVVGAGFGGYLVLGPTYGGQQEALCSILIDRTGSSVGAEVSGRYLAQARKMINGCAERNASLTIAYFSDDGLKLRKPPGASQDEYELFRPETRRPSVERRHIAEERQSAVDDLESVFTDVEVEAGGHGSDLLTALDTASVDLVSEAQSDRVDDIYLLVLSDGTQTGEELGFRRTFRGPHSSVEAHVQRAASAGLLPDLANVQVSFVGVDGGRRAAAGQAPAWYEAKVRDFWGMVVARGGGKMCTYDLEQTSLPGVC